MQERNIYIIGHKNPDTDSICSAIAYADIKNRTDDKPYVAKRAGDVSAETMYVLNRFHTEAPGYVVNVGPKVRDMDIRQIKGVPGNLSMKKAWALMRQENVNTLPITQNDNELVGLITISDIAKSYMDVYDSSILSTARTQYRNIVETLDGEMIIGNEHGYFMDGKVLVAAANPDLMESYIEEGDLVILGNRYESQLCAIEMAASCIIVCEGAPVSKTIRHLAEDKACVIISTPHDAYTASRLINQSIPVQQFMKKNNLVCFHRDDFIDDVKDIMARLRHRDFPVLDKYGKYTGMVSRRNLLGVKKRRLILVDHNEAAQAVDNIGSAEILEIIDHHRLGSLQTMAPVYFRNQPVGCTATIMYQIYQEKGLEIPQNIAGLLMAAIISDTLMFRSPTCTAVDRNAAEQLAQIAGVNCEEFAREMFAAGSNLTGKTPEEIFHQDFKVFEQNKISFGVGQISSMSLEELEDIKGKLQPYLEEALGSHGESMLFFMLTDIIHESTELLCYGKGSRELVREAFHREAEGDIVRLDGVVSRKKQLVPALIDTLQQ